MDGWKRTDTSIFESTLNPATRRHGGMHYTSIENIHKVIDPLFLDGYKERFHEAMQEKQTKRRIERLRDLQRDLGRGQYFDPACGSGNFLTESYLSLRRLENDILRETLMGESGTGVLGLDFAGSSEEDYVHVSIQQFHGIEINDFATSVAKTALWIAESQMFRETEDIIHKEMDFLPLHTNSNIHEGNALRMDWKSVLPPSDDVKILGNPPFVGARLMEPMQKEDLKAAFGPDIPQNQVQTFDGTIQFNGTKKYDGWKNLGNLDYVTGWYKKPPTTWKRPPSMPPSSRQTPSRRASRLQFYGSHYSTGNCNLILPIGRSAGTANQRKKHTSTASLSASVMHKKMRTKIRKNSSTTRA